MIYWKEKLKKGCSAICLAMALTMLAGCSKGVTMMTDSKASKGYSLSQTMMIVETEKNSYEDIYTSQIWEVEVKGATFQSHLLSQIKSFLEDMKTMNLLASDRAVSLDSEERAAMVKAAEEYFGGLSEADKAYMDNITMEDVTSMYEEYMIANKLVNELTKDVNLEVSDSEAKVISILEIKTDSEEAALAIYERVTAEGANFENIAKEYNTGANPLRLLGRGEEEDSFENIAFSLQTGEISQVFQYKDAYYILQCASDYNEEETKIRKDQIYTERKKQAFRRIYDGFKAENGFTYQDDFWSDITFDGEKHGADVDFFEIYKKYGT